MRVLAIVSYFPVPQNHGDALRRLMMLQALDTVGHLTIAAARRVDTTDADELSLRTMFPSATVITGPLAFYSGPSVVAKICRTLIGVARLTPPWVFQQWSPTLSRAIDALDPAQFDLVVMVGESSALYARSINGSRFAWDKSNVLLASDIDTIRGAGSAAARLRALVTLPITRRFEKRAVDRSDEVWVTTAEEGERLERLYRRGASAIIPSCVPLTDDAVDIDPSSKTIVWMSTMSYRPNWDGLCAFLKANDDALSASGFTVRVIGTGGSPAKQRHLERFASVEYLGFVADLRSAFTGVACAVVPVWAGAGVKLKTLTFMGYGLPVISTPVGMEGIPVDAATTVVPRADGFASALSALTPEQLREGAVRGRMRVLDSFSPATFVAEVVAAVNAEHLPR